MATKMLKLSLAHCGRLVWVNPHLVTSVCDAAQPDDEEGAVPADYVAPTAYVFVTGDVEGLGVREDAASIVNMLEEVL